MVNMMRFSQSHRSPSVPLAQIPPETVAVWTYTKGSLPIPWREHIQVEQVCTKVAQLCGIPRLTSNLFALYDTVNQTWCCPSSCVEPNTQHRRYVYQMRFHTSTGTPTGDSSGFLMLEESVVNYMFCQYREKFIKDEIRLKTEESLGLVVLDFMQHVKENNIPITNINGRTRFGRFLPKSLNDGMTWWDKRKLRRKVRSAVNDFRDDPREAFAFKVMFLVSLSEEWKQHWGVEKFTTVSGDVYEVSGSRGINKVKSGDRDEDHLNDSFEYTDILNIILYPSNETTGQRRLQINRRSTPPMFLEMNSSADAVSLASLLDGYYRLLVDYYHYLNQEIAPPSLVGLVRTRCHGPIPLSKAKQKIEEAGPHDGVYLIRQNPEDHYSYCLTVRIDQELKNFKINHYETDHVGLDNQPNFTCLRSFAEYYRNRENSWCLEGQLTKAVPIEPKERTLRLLDSSALNEELPPQPSLGPQIEWIREDDLSAKENWRLLGNGDFTTVWSAHRRKRIGAGPKPRRVPVAIKYPKADAPQTVQQKFSQSVDVMSSWLHKHIIRFEGIGAGYLLIMEYAMQGPLDHYLKSLVEHDGRGLGLGSQLLVAFQLIDALEYLESRRIVHGNISSHNTLVYRGLPRLHIKLGDPMLSVYYHSLQMSNPEKLKRVRWTAPELLTTNAEPTLAGDKFSYAITLWEIMSQGAIPYETLTNQEVRDYYRRGLRLEKPPNCPQEIFNIMESCWCHVPKNRPPCKGVLRDVNSHLQSYCSEGYMDVLPNDEEVEPIPEDDEEDETDMGRQNDDNERKANPSQNTPYESVTAAEAAAGVQTERQTDSGLLETIKQFMVPADQEQDVDPDEETTFFGVDKIRDGMLRRDRTLGQGHFGVVFLGKLKNMHTGGSEEDVAVKEIKTDRRDSKPEQFQQEIQAMARCDHKNIVKVLGYCRAADNTNRLQLVMEYFELGSLEKYLQKKKDEVSHRTLYLFGQQICQGMNYLHEEQRMVHRDLAARNVLVASPEEVKITDFGLARIFGGDKDYYRAKESNQKVPIKWYAPEWLSHNKYRKESDIWSFGIVLWEMFSYGQDPVYRDHSGKSIDVKNLLDYFQDGNRLTPPRNCPSQIDQMMRDCWQLKPDRRPRFSDMIHRLGRLVE